MKVLNRYQKEKLKYWKVNEKINRQKSAAGMINIKINKIGIILIIVYIIICAVKNTKIISTLAKIGEII